MITFSLNDDEELKKEEPKIFTELEFLASEEIEFKGLSEIKLSEPKKKKELNIQENVDIRKRRKSGNSNLF